MYALIMSDGSPATTSMDGRLVVDVKYESCGGLMRERGRPRSDIGEDVTSCGTATSSLNSARPPLPNEGLLLSLVCSHSFCQVFLVGMAFVDVTDSTPESMCYKSNTAGGSPATSQTPRILK